MLSWIKKIPELDIHQVFLMILGGFYIGFMAIIVGCLFYNKFKKFDKVYDKPVIEDSTGIKELIFKK